MSMTALNAMTVDVEEHFQVSAFSPTVNRSDWPRLESRVVDNTERLLDLFDRSKVRATFFVLGWVADRHPGLVNTIVRRGHEIGSHGWSHELIHEQSPEGFRSELERSRKLLQDLSGQPVEGHRAASFSIGRSNLWALDTVAETGFRYDSSLFPVRHDRYGMPQAPREIHRLKTPGGNMLIEFPPSTWSIAGQNVPIAGGGYLRLYPLGLTQIAIRCLNRRGQPAMVYVHPWEVDPHQPRINAPLKSRFRHYVGLHGTARKLATLMGRFRFAPMSEVIAGINKIPEVTLP
jgi:polysaccharide deacetylase family protein (PEP-CTERM system associated)